MHYSGLEWKSMGWRWGWLCFSALSPKAGSEHEGRILVRSEQNRWSHGVAPEMANWNLTLKVVLH